MWYKRKKNYPCTVVMDEKNLNIESFLFVYLFLYQAVHMFVCAVKANGDLHYFGTSN